MASGNVVPLRPAHPNDLDRKRIERSLKSRKRYKYVKPRVATAPGGYRVESPCCSRNIDPEGGVIDIALLIYDAAQSNWQLFRKDHEQGTWELHSTSDRMFGLLDDLNLDPDRLFWQ